MRELLIVRHAIACERNPLRWPDDALRPLTPRGRRRFERAARGLRAIVGVDLLLTSPDVRAVQTAALLGGRAGWPEPEICEALAAGRPATRLPALLADRPQDRIALVGHEPQLGRLIALLICGHEAPPLPLKKGGAALIALRTPRRTRAGELRWLLAPRLLRDLGRR